MSKHNKLPAIQGLRSLAVLSVVCFHFWPSFFTGGYVGVDIFFVISGFVITLSTLREYEQTGTFSVKEFYARRIRRLMPLALIVLAFSAIGSIFFYLKPFFMMFSRKLSLVRFMWRTGF
ncbi:acyltransferase [Ochrobactrum daejeonense]|nr:acyltransferase [Brucella daejeonensis]